MIDRIIHAYPRPPIVFFAHHLNNIKPPLLSSLPLSLSHSIKGRMVETKDRDDSWLCIDK